MGNAGAERRTNRLAGETSPYLLQHAENPVDWFPWGPEALARAKELDRPILLSIGYAACHWCHVMERESFEDEAIAALMNAHYVCVKVDREERPDLDDIYMAATVAMSGGGGWPMTVFLTPDQKPFFAGTYFPPTAKYGKPSFTMLLERLHEAWMKERETVVAQAGQLTEIVAQQAQPIPPAAIGPEVGESAVVALAKTFDKKEGGFGGAPKFPPHQSLALLLRHHRSLGKATSLSLDMVRLTLDRMKDGGIYDHVGGGFCRYATDAIWLVPHFEKMLYDNAQLARVYTDAFVVTGDLEYARVAKETLDYVVREMQGTHGGYFSATDADSEGVEGKFFVFSLAEIEELLGDDAALFAQAFDVTEHGNWEEQNIVHLARPLSELAREQDTTPEALRITLRKNLDTLYAAREKRVHPLLDDKVLAAWNGLMIGAMAEGARVFGDPKYLESATRAAKAVTDRLTRPDGGLYRTFRSTGPVDKAHLDAYLEDYAFLGDGLVDLYEAAGDAAHLHLAKSLCDRMIADFRADDGGGFLFTAKDHEALLVRPREGADNATPSPNGVAARLCARLGAHFGDDALRARAEDAIAAYGRIAFRQPRPFSTSIMVAEMLASPPTEVVLVGDPSDPAFVALDRALAGAFLPNRALARLTSLPAASLPLLEGRGDSLVPARAYVCEKFVCLAPITDPDELARALAKPR